MKKYILAPGFITQNGKRRYIGVAQLLSAYQVTMDECVIYHPDRPLKCSTKLQWLTPRQDGNYALPEAPQAP